MISVITCSIDPLKFNAVSAMWQSVFAAEPWEMIGIHDAKSMAEGYTRGVQKAKGELLIFAHDDIEIISEHFTARLKKHFESFDIVGVAGASKLVSPAWFDAGPPFIFGQVVERMPGGTFFINIFGAPAPVVGNIKVLDGVFIAAQRGVLDRIPFDAATFDGFHLYDLDFCIRAHQAGYRLGVACDVNLIHASSGNYDQAWRDHAARFVQKHQNAMELQLGTIQRSWSFVEVKTLAHALLRMMPEYWDV
jgi:GT2 family glycosyltransferase